MPSRSNPFPRGSRGRRNTRQATIRWKATADMAITVMKLLAAAVALYGAMNGCSPV
ncbi:hypothetical protein AB0C41_19750 [Micromonospora taraxaci]|uniref:hypothetical protein n=1 Tax=Micromonospora taraxaci TaxID=1316803 RepID=UPI00340D865C